MRLRQDPDAFMRMQRLRDTVLQALETEQRRKPARAATFRPPMDLIATDDAYVLQLDLPGVTREDINATVDESVVRVSGSTGKAVDFEGATRLRGERQAGVFARSVRLPGDADVDDVSAKLDDGVLDIRVGRKQRGDAHIEIEIG